MNCTKEFECYVKEKVLARWSYENGVFTHLKTGSHGANVKGRLYIKVDYKMYSTAQLVFLMEYGVLPITNRTTVIDHINGNPLDDRPENLRIVSQQENTRNNKRRREQKLPNGVYINPRGLKTRVRNAHGYSRMVDARYEDVKAWLVLNSWVTEVDEVLSHFEPSINWEYRFRPNGPESFNLEARRNSISPWRMVQESIPYSKFRALELMAMDVKSHKRLKEELRRVI